MAKGITIFGTLNGTLGETVYYRSGGEQKQRIRNRKPKNPKTNKQIFQRARFSAAGMFYTHGRQAFFPYAFEDKKQNESNFNAFMRNNTSLAYPVSKSVVNNVAYPILQNWVVTKGSLPSLKCYRHSPDDGETTGIAFNFPLYTSQEAINTMADLSRALIATGDYDNGDIITFLTILTDIRLDSTGYGLYPAIVPSQSEGSHWFIRQFNLNTADTTPLGNYNIAATILQTNEVRVNVWGYNSSWWPNQLAAGTIVHSRVKGSRTQVSTQALVLSEYADEQINTLLVNNYSTYVDEVIENWKSGDEGTTIRPTEILQGSNSVNFDFVPVQDEEINISVEDNGYNLTIPASYVQNHDFSISPNVQLRIGDSIAVYFKLKIQGAINSWDCVCNSVPFSEGVEELHYLEEGQNVFQQGWLKYGGNNYIYITNNELDYIGLGFLNTTSTEDTYQITFNKVVITHSDGTKTICLVQ